MYSAPTIRFNNDGFNFHMTIVPIEDFTLDELMDKVFEEARFFGTYALDGRMQFDLRNEEGESSVLRMMKVLSIQLMWSCITPPSASAPCMT